MSTIAKNMTAVDEAESFTCGKLSETAIKEIAFLDSQKPFSLNELRLHLIAKVSKGIAQREATMFRIGREAFFKVKGIKGVNRGIVPANKTGKAMEARSFLLSPADGQKPAVFHSPKWKDGKGLSSEVQASTLEEMESAARCAIIAFLWGPESTGLLDMQAMREGHRAARLAITRIQDKRITPICDLASDEAELASEEPIFMQEVAVRRHEAENIRESDMEHRREKSIACLEAFWGAQKSSRKAIGLSNAIALVHLIFDRAQAHDEEWRKRFTFAATNRKKISRLKDQIAEGALLLQSKR